MTKMQKKQLVINESTRYLDNALEILKTKAKPTFISYEDKKYVRMAGHTAYLGILYAINETGLVNLKKGQRPDGKDYIAVLAKENGKMKDYFNACYQVFHIDAGYDGFADKRKFPEYIKDAKILIEWAASKASAA